MFKKYPSIENSYRDKFLQYSLDQFPDLQDAVFIITEKIDGANIQLIFDTNGVMTVASRSRVLPSDDTFFGVWDVLAEMTTFTQHMCDFVRKTNQTINLYGELFGPGIQRRIDYGPKRRILFFDARINGELLPAGEFCQFIANHAGVNYQAPILEVVFGLQAALEFDVGRVSSINPVEGNFIEGVVIKPRDKVYQLHCGSTFYLKKKGAKFGEKEQRVKVKKVQAEIRPEVAALHHEFVALINDNRVKSVFSKEGEIQEMKQIGQYIKLVVADAKEDFVKDHEDDLAPFNKDELKFVYNVGNIVVGLLKEYL